MGINLKSLSSYDNDIVANNSYHYKKIENYRSSFSELSNLLNLVNNSNENKYNSLTESYENLVECGTVDALNISLFTNINNLKFKLESFINYIQEHQKSNNAALVFYTDELNLHDKFNRSIDAKKLESILNSTGTKIEVLSRSYSPEYLHSTFEKKIEIENTIFQYITNNSEDYGLLIKIQNITNDISKILFDSDNDNVKIMYHMFLDTIISDSLDNEKISEKCSIRNYYEAIGNMRSNLGTLANIDDNETVVLFKKLISFIYNILAPEASIKYQNNYTGTDGNNIVTDSNFINYCVNTIGKIADIYFIYSEMVRQNLIKYIENSNKIIRYCEDLYNSEYPQDFNITDNATRSFSKDFEECSCYLEIYRELLNEAMYQHNLNMYLSEGKNSNGSGSGSQPNQNPGPNNNNQQNNQSSNQQNGQNNNDKQNSGENQNNQQQQNQNNTQQNNQNDAKKKKENDDGILERIIDLIRKIIDKIKALFDRFMGRTREIATANANTKFWNSYREKIRTLDLSNVEVSDWYDYDYDTIVNKSLFVEFDILKPELKSNEDFGNYIIKQVTGNNNITYSDGDFSNVCKDMYVTKYFDSNNKVKYSGTETSKHTNDLIVLLDDYFARGGDENTTINKSIYNDINKIKAISDKIANKEFMEQELEKIKKANLNESVSSFDLYNYTYTSYLTETSKASKSNLSSSEFGVKELRKFPLDTKKHVLSAVKFFNYVDPAHENELAKNILSKIKKFGIDLKSLLPKNSNNRFSKYIKIKESVGSLEENFNLAKELGLNTLHEIEIDTHSANIDTGDNDTEQAEDKKQFGILQARVNRYLTFMTKALGARETQALAMIKQTIELYKMVFNVKSNDDED